MTDQWCILRLDYPDDTSGEDRHLDVVGPFDSHDEAVLAAVQLYPADYHVLPFTPASVLSGVPS